VLRVEFFRTASFRWAITFASILIVTLGVFSGLMYWQTARYLTKRVDRELQDYADRAMAVNPRFQDPLQSFFSDDPREFKIAGIFDAANHALAGNLRQLPADLPPTGTAGNLKLEVSHDGHPAVQRLRVLTRRLPDGRLLVMGRGVTAIHEINEIVNRGLLLALVPTIVLALGIGIVISRAALRRIAEVHRTSRLIMAGEMNRRLEVRGSNDDFDKLARIVNEMLDEIERLMAQAKGAGEDIAHDLRTPLTRLRGRLERGLAGKSADTLQTSLVAAIEDVDQLLGTIGAILRIAEVDHGQRRAAFRMVDLAYVAREAVDLYEPVAEQKGILLFWHAEAVSAVRGDGDLLFEAVANLLDNAIKFTPPKGQVSVSIQQDDRGPSIRVTDSGPGIPAADFPKVLGRFYRADQSRQTPGTGLGLSLVASIARLHGFGLALRDQPAGCCIELECWQRPGITRAAATAAIRRNDSEAPERESL
jgi:signal transduction histidine kinase